jgi:hypothetical protein
MMGRNSWLTSLVACSLFACSSSNDDKTNANGTGGAGTGTGGAMSMAGAGTGAGTTNGGAPGGGGTPTMGPGGASNGGAITGAGGAVVGGSGQGGSGTGGGGAPAGGSGGSAGAAGGGSGGDPGPVVMQVDLPDNKPGIGFDDMRYSPELKKLIVPAGRTGAIDLVDPQSLQITTISGFTASMSFTLGKHRNGSTSADYGNGKIFAIDNETKTVKVVDPTTKMVTGSTMLANAPDYIRWVEPTKELWVTMPQNPGVTVTMPEIEVLKVPDTGPPTHSMNITFPTTGPEALYIDTKRNRAYTNNGFGGNTYAVDLMTHMTVETWKNGCTALTVDLEYDDARGFLMVVCAAGRLAVLDVANGGKQVGEISMVGMGVDVSAYNPTLHHMYLAGQTSMDLSIIGITAAGMPMLLGKVMTTNGSQMVEDDEFGNAWVGDPGGGRLIKVRDTYPATN